MATHILIARDSGQRFHMIDADYGLGERVDHVLRRLLAGETLEGIARDFGVTRERIRLIACKGAGQLDCLLYSQVCR